jgi:signal transduction histidine kinase
MQEGIIAVWHDVTAWKEAEAGLRSLNETLEERVVERTTQVRTLASTLTLAEQEERRRISQILHDDLQQRLYGIQIRVLSIITDVAANNQSRLPRYAQEVYGWIGDAIQTTRQLTVELSPPVLKNEGLADALAWLATQMAAVNGLQVEIQATHPCSVPQEDMRVLLFQSVRELLFNVVKDAATDHATVELTETTTGELRIVVRDEGRGFDVTAIADKPPGGFGLFSVRERLNLFGGRLEIASTPGKGTEITIYAPIAP